MMTKGQADATATLVATLRPDWDHAGVMAALAIAKARGPAHEVATAAIRAAAVPSNRTPAVIALEGPHWNRPTAPSAAGTVGPWDQRACARCSWFHDPGPCLRLEPEAAERGVEAAREALAQAKRDAATERDRIAQAIADAGGTQ